MLIQVFFVVLMISVSSVAAVRLPGGLQSSDQESVTRILGWGTGSKILSDPYPLGGFSGLELGIQTESLPTDELAKLGNKTPHQERFTYPRISIGKGLYSNIDAFVHFIPFQESTGLSEYGGIIRWNFYQATFIPAGFSLQVFGNNSNVSNQFFSQSIGSDLIMGVNMNNVSAYFGFGKISTFGRFVGGTNGITSTGKSENVTVDGLHTQLGLIYHLRPLFVAFQIDHYTQPVFSAKLGVRY